MCWIGVYIVTVLCNVTVLLFVDCIQFALSHVHVHGPFCMGSIKCKPKIFGQVSSRMQNLADGRFWP